MDSQGMWRRTALTLTIALGWLALPRAGRAERINPALGSSPVITSGFGTLSYTASSGNFHTDMFPLLYFNDLLPPNSGSFASGTTTIDLFVDMTGKFVSSGSGVTVMGDVDLDGDNMPDLSGLLLQGRITAFGAQMQDPMMPSTMLDFDGLFRIEGGLLTGPITFSGGIVFGGLPIGGLAAFLLNAENTSSGTVGDFTQNFSSDRDKSIIADVVPEPATVLLALIGDLNALAAYQLNKERLEWCPAGQHSERFGKGIGQHEKGPRKSSTM